MKILYRAIFAFMLLYTFKSGKAQTDSAKSPLNVSGYLETYYVYDFNNPPDHNRPNFVYSYNRSNEVNLNIGLIKTAYEKNNVRSNLALMTGTYPNANLASEPGVLKNVYEANVGVKISKNKNIWIDAGIFASHIGFESAIGKNCWILTRSILADNSPYYESGAKISYTSKKEKWFLSGLILNGWQHIQRPNNNNNIPAFGHQLTYKPTSKITLNSSSFVGSDSPDSTHLMRYFHNFYGIFQLSSKFGIITGFDIGLQQKYKNSSSYNVWYTPILIARYSVTDKFFIAARGEYYNDANGVIIYTGTTHGFQTYGYSINFDYVIANNVLWRIEARAFNSVDKIFLKDNKFIDQNNFVSTSLAISF